MHSLDCPEFFHLFPLDVGVRRSMGIFRDPLIELLQDLDPKSVPYLVIRVVTRAACRGSIRVLGLAIEIKGRAQEIAPTGSPVETVGSEYVERLQSGGVQRTAHGHEEALLQDGGQAGVVVEPLWPEQTLKGCDLGNFTPDVTQNGTKRLGQH
ncbi:uncharacterized protein PG998_010601 [Apiospora kogelbergensis]|uniref:Uncharacterized protein n=1 Tax=Apiospora kogelbergensis TaxID=1337665 RepID=A0AAW0RDW5_9PEZI